MIDYAERIQMDLYRYHYDHNNKLPEAIFMSDKLAPIVLLDSSVMLYNTPNGVVCTFHTVPVQIYSSDKLEYYLAESGRVLD